MKLKCIQTVTEGIFTKTVIAKAETSYFGQIAAAGDYGTYLAFVYFGDDKNWHLADLNNFEPIKYIGND